jgi:hypothetical protein
MVEMSVLSFSIYLVLAVMLGGIWGWVITEITNAPIGHQDSKGFNAN